MAGAGRFAAEADATAWSKRATAGERSDRSLEADCRRIYRGPFRAGESARGCAFCARPPARTALPVRTDFEGGHPTQVEETLRDKDHSRNSFSRRITHAYPANLHFARAQLLWASRKATRRLHAGRSTPNPMRRRPRDSR